MCSFVALSWSRGSASNSRFGDHLVVLITDLDGTLIDLPVDWKSLRVQLSVGSVEDLWSSGGPWDLVTEAECVAAQLGALVATGVDLARQARCFAVITANDASAAAITLDRLGLTPQLVVGRQELGGSKRNLHRFGAAVARCLDALAPTPGESVLYAGDQNYELDFATALGLTPVRINSA
jgi:hypothetical protein